MPIVSKEVCREQMANAYRFKVRRAGFGLFDGPNRLGRRAPLLASSNITQTIAGMYGHQESHPLHGFHFH